MDSDDELLGCMMDAMEQEEGDDEDWTDTNWAQPSGADVASLFQLGGAKHNIEVTQTVAETEKENEPADPSVVKRMLLNDNKAGMEGLDKEKINQIIHEASKGSKYYENERQKEEQMKKRIEQQQQKIATITEAQLKEGLMEADRQLEDFDQQRDLSHTIVHTDMDAFYAAVEMRDRPELKHKPMAVGGTAMLTTSNYLARKYGVRAAMPGFIGKKLCPELVIVPANFDKYTAVSKQVRAIFTCYDPNFCPMSLDEAYLDITEHLEERKTMSDLERTYVCRHRQFVDSKNHCLCDLNDVAKNHGANAVDPENVTVVDLHSYLMNGRTFDCLKEADTASVQEVDQGEEKPLCPICSRELPPFYCVRFGITDEDAVKELRTRIEQKTRLTASAGIAPNMMLAKVCSDRNKPNGQFKVPPTKTDVINFIRDLPTRKISGKGKVSEAMLNALGVYTYPHLYEKRALLYHLYSPISFNYSNTFLQISGTGKISGIGKVSEAMLNALGVYTCPHLYEKRALLYHLYSPISFNYFIRICLGIGSTTVERDSERKSMSTERTFSELSRPADLYRKCEELCESLAEDLKTELLKGKTVGIKIKTVKFEVKTKAHTLREYTSDKECLLKAASDLLRAEIQACAPHPLRLRLMGVRMSNLLPESHIAGKRQRTILGAFKKMSKKQSSADPRSRVSEFVPGSQLKASSLATFDGHEGNEQTDDVAPPAEDSKAVRICSENTVENLDAKESKESNKDCLVKTGIGLGDNGLVQIKDNFIQEEKEVADNEIIKTDNHASDSLELLETGCAEVLGVEHVSKCTVTTSNVVDASVPGGEKNVIADSVATTSQCDRQDTVAVNRRRTRSGFVCTPNTKQAKKRRNSKKDQPVSYNCPVCNKDVVCCDLNEFNKHVDECLNLNSTEDANTHEDECLNLNSTEDANTHADDCLSLNSKEEANTHVEKRLSLHSTEDSNTYVDQCLSLNSTDYTNTHVYDCLSLNSTEDANTHVYDCLSLNSTEDANKHEDKCLSLNSTEVTNTHVHVEVCLSMNSTVDSKTSKINDGTNSEEVMSEGVISTVSQNDCDAQFRCDNGDGDICGNSKVNSEAKCDVEQATEMSACTDESNTCDNGESRVTETRACTNESNIIDNGESRVTETRACTNESNIIDNGESIVTAFIKQTETGSDSEHLGCSKSPVNRSASKDTDYKTSKSDAPEHDKGNDEADLNFSNQPHHNHYHSQKRASTSSEDFDVKSESKDHYKFVMKIDIANNNVPNFDDVIENAQISSSCDTTVHLKEVKRNSFEMYDCYNDRNGFDNTGNSKRVAKEYNGTEDDESSVPLHSTETHIEEFSTLSNLTNTPGESSFSTPSHSTATPVESSFSTPSHSTATPVESSFSTPSHSTATPVESSFSTPSHSTATPVESSFSTPSHSTATPVESTFSTASHSTATPVESSFSTPSHSTATPVESTFSTPSHWTATPVESSFSTPSHSTATPVESSFSTPSHSTATPVESSFSTPSHSTATPVESTFSTASHSTATPVESSFSTPSHSTATPVESSFSTPSHSTATPVESSFSTPSHSTATPVESSFSTPSHSTATPVESSFSTPSHSTATPVESSFSTPSHSTATHNEESDQAEPDSGLLVCPICNAGQRCGSLVDFNAHIDACLSRGAIREMLSEQKKKETRPLKRASISPMTASGSQPAKRRKTVLPQKPVPCRSIMSFFNDK